MSRSDLARDLGAVLGIARRASAVVEAVYAAPFTVELKGPNDPVTRADREANELICNELIALFPSDAILAEESVPAAPEAIAALVEKERVWFVDPLDGTREFADRNGEFSVMIGLAVRGRAALGVVVVPATGQAFAGCVGGPAFVEEKTGARRSLVISTVDDPRRATLLVSRSRRPAIIDPLVEALDIPRIIGCGSVGVKVARIASGEADLYVHGGRGAKAWDCCAPEAILVAAGGRFTHLDGGAFDYSSADLAIPNGILASNGALYDRVLAFTSRAAE